MTRNSGSSGGGFSYAWQEVTALALPHKGYNNDEPDLLAHGQYFRETKVMVSMSMADEDGLDIPQNLPDVIWFVRMRAKESAHLAPRPLAGFKEDAPLVRDTNQVSGN